MPWNKDGSRKSSAFYKMKGSPMQRNFGIPSPLKDFKTSKDKDTFLINPFGLRYDEITASNLVEVTLKGKVINSDSPINDTGFIIHGAIHPE